MTLYFSTFGIATCGVRIMLEIEIGLGLGLGLGQTKALGEGTEA